METSMPNSQKKLNRRRAARLYQVAVVLLSILALIPALHSPAVAQSANQQVGGALLSPTGYRLQARAGLKAELPFTVANPGQTPTRVGMKLVSYLQREQGGNEEGVAHARDASIWFAERSLDFALAPGEKKIVKLPYNTPRAIAAGSFWCMLKFTAKPVSSLSTAAIELNAPIFFTLGSERPQAKISSPSLVKMNSAAANSPFAIVLPLENAGKNILDISASGEMKNVVTGRALTTFDSRAEILLPGAKMNLRFGAPKIADGRYKLTFKTEVGSRRLPPVSSEFVVLKGEPSAATDALTMALPPIAIEPQGFSLMAPAGSMRTQTLRLTNLSDREILLDIAPRSVEQPRSGSIGLSEEPLPDELKITVSPAFVTVRPKSTAVTRVIVTADKGLEGEKWFGLALTERGNANAFSETVLGSMAIQDTTKPRLEVADCAVDEVNGRPLGVTFALRNSGNQALQLVPNAAVLEGGIRLIANLEVPIQGSGGILPGAELPNLVMLPPDLKPGEYIVEISYQYGGELFAKARVPIAVKAEKTPAPATMKTPQKTPQKTPTKNAPTKTTPHNKPQ